MFDLHLHSYYSDGMLAPAELVKRVAATGVRGLALTDHNGLWGIDEAALAAAQFGLKFVEGIEVSSQTGGEEIHLLGYSRHFDREILDRGLRGTRRGYLDKMSRTVRCLRRSGFNKISWQEIRDNRRALNGSLVMWTDLARQLRDKHYLTLHEARVFLTAGGACYIPYGEWALSAAEAIALIHNAGGVAILAHPAYLVKEGGINRVTALVDRLRWDGLDGLEVFSPGILPKLRKFLLRLARHHSLLATGGSDWHGPGMYAGGDEAFGIVGVNKEQHQALIDRLS